MQPTLAAGTGSAACGELHDDARAVGPDALHDAREAMGCRRRRAVVVALVQVHQRRTGPSSAAWVDSTCSAMEIGTAGLSRFCGKELVMATVTMQGVITACLHGAVLRRWR